MQRRYRNIRPVCLRSTGAGPIFSIDDWTLSESIFSMELFFKMSDWTPSADRMLIEHGTVDGNISFTVDMLAGGNIRLSYFPTGLLASRVSATFPADGHFRDNKIAGIRCNMFANFFGQSVFGLDHWHGGTWQYAAGIGAAPLAVFNSTATIDVGSGDDIEEIYAFRVWTNDYFGIVGTHRRNEMDLDALGAPQPLNTTDWTDRFGNHYVLGNAEFQRSDYPAPFAA